MAKSRTNSITNGRFTHEHMDAHADVPRFINGELPGGVVDVEAVEGSASWSGLANAGDDLSSSSCFRPSRRNADGFHKTVGVTRDRTSLTPLWQPHQSALHDTRR